MREVDRLTTEKYGIPSLLLMENAAHAVARVITEKLGGSVKGKSILILCGKGNNGGDGSALARVLHQEGARIEIYLFGDIEETKGDARTNFDRLQQTASTEYTAKGNLYFEVDPLIDYWVHTTGAEVGDFDIAVDALFGTGLTRPLDTLYRNVPYVWNRRYTSPDLCQNEGTIRLSIDVPSGLFADSELVPEIHFEADTTVTFSAPKLANVLPPPSRANGELIIADIGSPRELIDEQKSQLYVAEAKDAENWLRRTEFSSDDYKNRRGHAFIVAGSEDYSGAAVMCGNAAMRSGVGLTTLLVPTSCKIEVASRVIPEVIVRTLGEKDGEVSSDAFAVNEESIRQADSILVGPGLKVTDRGVERFVREIVENRTVPVIVDAGALWFFNPPDGLLHKPARKQGRNIHVTKESDHMSRQDIALAHARACALVLTPHEGEFLRLRAGQGENHPVGETPTPLLRKEGSLKEDRVAAVREFAVANDVILVLKGERVLIGSPDGRVVVNPTGNSGLGKAGNGDTLAGILAGFTAQAVKFEIDIFETVVAAVYVAGMAGDVAEKKYGKRVMTASDVRECLADVFSLFDDREAE